MEAIRMMNRKMLIFVMVAVSAVTIAVALYTFMPRSRFDSGLMEKLAVDDMAYSNIYGWVFANHENYNGEFVLYIEGLHRIVFAAPAREQTEISGRPDIAVRMGKELRIYGNIMLYGGRQYAILEYGSYTLPPWASEALLSGIVKAFTSLGRELTGVDYEVFPIVDAVTLYRVSPLTISPYENYFLDVNECRVYDNTVEYLLNGGVRVTFTADTMEFVYSTDAEIDRAFREGALEYYEYD
jgi:hypothetical protein